MSAVPLPADGGPAIDPIGNMRHPRTPELFPLTPFTSTQPDSPNAQGDWIPTKAGIQYITPNEGGAPAPPLALGWSTGFAGHQLRTAPFTGRMVTPPTPRVDSRGPVGVDNRAALLAAGVQQQQRDLLPDLGTIARSFTRGPQV